jgi:hypothetical protein
MDPLMKVVSPHQKLYLTGRARKDYYIPIMAFVSDL